VPVDDEAAVQSPKGRGTVRLVCYTDTPWLGGSPTSLATLIGALDARYAVTVMGTTAAVVRLIAGSRPDTAQVVIAPVRSKFDLRGILEHVRVLRGLRPDILHVNMDNPWTSSYGLLAGILTRTPMVAVVHSPAPPWNRRQRWLALPVARFVHNFVGVSEHLARYLESILDLRAGSTRVIHNGIAVPTHLAPRPSTPEPIIGAVGRLSNQKGVQVLITAMQSLPGYQLVLVGEGYDREELEVLARETGVGERVTFAGWTEPPWTSHWNFDVLAVPSFLEGFPLVVVEAMLAGIPVVATPVGGIPEIVVPEDTGLLVPTGDADALSQAIARLVTDDVLRTHVIERSRALAMERFTAATMAAAFEALYDEIRR
jgi:glycosyltransferase involved in cell wall biosynthesis